MANKFNALMSLIPDKPVSESTSQKVLFAGLNAGIPVLSLKAFKPSLPISRLATAGIIGGIIGYKLPEITNKLIEYKKQNRLKDALEDFKLMSFPEKYSPSIKKLIDMGKQASWIGAMGAANKGVGWAAKRLVKGFTQNPFSKAPIGEKVFGLAVKGGAAFGAGAAAKGLADATLQKRPYDYTTMMRNQMLSGRIRPEELNENDMPKVRKLGFA